MRVVITGASGFLGGAILRHLAEAGLDCVGVSRRDVPGLHRVSSYSETPGGDCLIHCAETNDRSMVNAGGQMIEAEMRRTLYELLAGSHRHIIYMSSAVLYGDQWMTPRKVSDPVEVVDGYTRIKHESERAVLERGGTVVRLANLYGPGMASGNVLSHIMQQLGGSSAITMHLLNPVRDFLWVDDAVCALRAMLKNESKGIYNVGSGRGTSIRELVQLVQAAAGSHKEVVALRTAERLSSLVLDISDTEQSLGWTPDIRLENGVRQLINIKMKSEIQ